MGIIQGNSRVSDASIAAPDKTTVDDCFGETDVLNLDGPDADGIYTQRLRIRIDMAKTYWRLAVCLYVAFILFALLSA